MSKGRPEILFPLFGDLTGLPGIGEKSAAALEGLHVTRPVDLLFTLPGQGIDRRLLGGISEVVPPAVATLKVTVLSHKAPSARGRPTRVMVDDGETSFPLVFFHARGDWLQRQLPVGAERIVSGKVEAFDHQVQMIHPDYMFPPEEAADLPRFEPIYPLAAGLSQKQMRKAVGGALDRVPETQEWADPSIVAREGWPAWAEAVRAAHHPDRLADLSADAPARQRLAYDEFLAHQLTLAIARTKIRRAKGRPSVGSGILSDRVLKSLPYSPTGAQTRALEEIRADMAGPARMNRLLQGDVGSGKTLVAMLAMLTAVEAGGQAAMMAPTEILARQHLEALTPLAAAAGIGIEVLTGRDSGAVRGRKLAALADGSAQIVLGTHALFQDDVRFADLRLAIIDEQHRFGVRQRMDLGAKGVAPDVLVMTATPIPRSLTLAQFGDMDISVLDEKPPGRKPVDTALVNAARLDEVIDRLARALDAGQRAYWVCPLVAESETLEKTAAEERFRMLRARLGEGRVALVHGQMKPADKDAAMADFVDGRAQLLVATTVIEVGVNVPEATIMVIEDAQGFGLAQLHQLRGRVGRGAEKSTCLLLYDEPLSDTARARLSIMRETEDGFRIAEEDLRLRGAGDVLGVAQSGLPRFRVADMEAQPGLMEMARDDARLLLSRDPDLTGPRGQAARVLLYLLDKDRSIALLSVG
ncbi:ATP-dependent DNA helicase RecG [Oceanomicrobium pacificus]|uniref:Probable DNA 3'-5' helicase RecG n=1 Tax=Oceanomicrobium pacificus TaxID=2692916 RepID=A0A6B0TXN9_9RHOB|nr:ATP-dependent DNA helicase RecG [Oceanomicrobium pacificus]MXU65894.1 ATP-dependent DNA helicase RecG [Oceanomicrobium pacificus]